MKKPTKQTVYLPVKEANLEKNYYLQDLNGEFYLEQKGYFFTPEQLNKYTRNVGKAFLETAAEKAEITNKAKFSGDYNPVVDENSITNTFEETFKKFEV